MVVKKIFHFACTHSAFVLQQHEQQHEQQSLRISHSQIDLKSYSSVHCIALQCIVVSECWIAALSDWIAEEFASQKKFVATSRVGGDCCLCQKRLSSLSRPHQLWPSPSLSCRFRRPIPHRCSLCHPMCLRHCPPQTRIWCKQSLSLSLDLFVAAASLLLLCALFACSLSLSLARISLARIQRL